MLRKRCRQETISGIINPLALAKNHTEAYYIIAINKNFSSRCCKDVKLYKPQLLILGQDAKQVLGIEVSVTFSASQTRMDFRSDKEDIGDWNTI